MTAKDITAEQLKETVHQLDELYKEHDQFVEVAGDFYCASDCNNCKYAGICEFEIEETFIDFILPLRSVIKAIPYKDNKEVQHKRILKEIKSHPESYKNNEIDHILYHPKDKTYYCIHQQCQECQYYGQGCEFELKVVPDSWVIYANDLRAQEPRSFLLSTLTTGNFERLWAETFCNDSIKEVGRPYYTLINMFKQAGVDVSLDNEFLHIWIDKEFFYNKTKLYELQDAMNRYYSNKSDESLKNLQEITDKLINSYNDFVASRS